MTLKQIKGLYRTVEPETDERLCIVRLYGTIQRTRLSETAHRHIMMKTMFSVGKLRKIVLDLLKGRVSSQNVPCTVSEKYTAVT